MTDRSGDEGSRPRLPSLGAGDQAEVARVLRGVLGAVEAGELDAPPLMLARMSGALDVLDSVAPAARPDPS